MNRQVLDKYELIEKREMSDLDSAGYLLRHKKSGAKVMILSNKDENKVFCIGFRTPVNNSTGVPHILEHSVLCGSEKFPGKDPFVELVKGSLNTFLNAMTYPDKTVYPVASCNAVDFQNLMHVYMDAVFSPNIYKKEEIFLQEGWHYELEEKDADLTLNGVVYNEMKGAFSSPEGVLDRLVLNSLFPDTNYANESGGDPECIPELSYEEFLAFHKKYYHPSNSYIYLYGDMDFEDKLIWIDENYLNRYELKEIDSEIKLQKPFVKTAEVKSKYSISMAEDEKDNTFLSYNKVIGTSLDKKLYIAFEILEYALLGAAGAPLKQALLDAGIGKDIASSYDNGIYQPIFSIIAKKANPEDKERFVNLITEQLKKISDEGIDVKAILAGINYFEFKYREADFGPYPKGLMYGLQAYDSWLYDEKLPFLHLEAGETFKELREDASKGYFEQLIKTYLLENDHASIVMICPEKGLNTKIDEALNEKLARYKAGLSNEEVEKLVSKTKALKKFQEEPSTKEELEAIPVLKLEDIKKECERIPLDENNINGISVMHTNIPTNGIGYLQLNFDLDTLEEKYIPYLGLLPHLLGYVDTEHYKYQDLFHEINIQTGGLSASLTTYVDNRDRKSFIPSLSIKTKVLYDQLAQAVDLINEIIHTSDMKDEKRLLEIIRRLKSRLQGSMVSSGHATASMRAMSYFSPVIAFNDKTSGVFFYQFIEQLEADFAQRKEELITNLEALMAHIFRKENLMVHYTADEDGYSILENNFYKLTDRLSDNKISKKVYAFETKKKNEGFLTSSKVQYVASAGNFVDRGYEYTGALRILKVLLSYEYLWINVRVKGGAYGCMSGFTRTGDSYLASYRDPHLKATKEIFEGTAAYLEKFEADEQTMRKYIIGTISDLDIPLNPSAKGSKVFSMFRSYISFDDLQKERDEILGASVEDIRQLAPIVQAIIDDDCFCVVGNEEKILEEKQLFMETKNLIRG